MNIFKILRFHVITLIIIASLIGFTYWNLPNTFFQQDEWQGFSEMIYYQSIDLVSFFNFFFPSDALSHFNPLGSIFALVEFLLFYTDFTPYGWLSILLHVFNSILLYCFVFTFLKNRKIAAIAGLFFGVNSISSQAVTWVAAANSYETPTAFIIVSFIFCHWFLVQEENKRKNLVLSMLMLLISLLFHEIGIFLFLFYPIIFLLYKKPKQKKQSQTFFYGIGLFMLVFLLVRIPFFFTSLHILPTVTDISRPPITVYPYRLISISIKSFAGSFFPEKTLIGFSDQVVRLAYPQFVALDNEPNPYISQLIVFDLVSYIMSISVICLIVLLIRFTREKKFLEALVWSFIFVPTSLLPYAFVLGKAGYSSIFSPQYYYVCSIGTSIIIAITFYCLLQKFSKSGVGKFLVLSILVLYLISHIYMVRAKVERLVKISVPIKSFLSTVISSYPKLPQNVIFYTNSNKAYYGMPDNEKSLPVQVGFGQMLMVWYQANEKLPGCFYKDAFLLDILTEGYRQCDDRGFGYFRNYDKLITAIKTNKISSENVISYSWNEKKEEFKNITRETQISIKKDIHKDGFTK